MNPNAASHTDGCRKALVGVFAMKDLLKLLNGIVAALVQLVLIALSLWVFAVVLMVLWAAFWTVLRILREG